MPNGADGQFPGQFPEVRPGGYTGFKRQVKKIPGFIPQRSPYIYAPAFEVPHYQQTRGQYGDLISQLQAQAAGEGPTIAQRQLQMGTERNISQLMSALASGAGFQPSGATQRAGTQQAAQARQQAVMDTSILRAQEMLSGRQALASALQQMSGLDIAQAEASMALQQLLAGGIRAHSREATSRRSSIVKMFSDEDLKKNIVKTEKDIQEFLDFLGGGD